MAGVLDEFGEAIESGVNSGKELDSTLEGVKGRLGDLISGAGELSDIIDGTSKGVAILGAGFLKLANEIGAARALSFLFTKTLMEIDDQVTDLVSGFGQVRGFSDAIQSTFIDINSAVFDLDVSTQDILDTFQGFNGELGTMLMLTAEEGERMLVLSEATGIAASEMGSMIAQMSDLGMGTLTAIGNIEKLAVEAQRLGLNVNTFIKNIGDNIKLVNQYGFDKGINGLAKMVAKAQALRFDIQQAVNIADGILDGGPERAVEMAAELAMLGGDIGELGDPFALMFNSLNDVGAIQDSLVDLASAAATVNEETGQLEIPTYARERLRQQAKVMGVSFEQLTTAALNSKKQMMALDEIEFSGLAGMSDEDKQFIATMSEINEKGEMVVKLKEGGETREIKLTDEEGIKAAMDDLRKQQEMDAMDPEDVLRENTRQMVSLTESIDKLTSKEALIKLGAGAFDTQPIQDVIQGLKESVVDVKETFQMTADNIGEIFKDGKVEDEEVRGLLKDTSELLIEDAKAFAERMGLGSEAVDQFVQSLKDAYEAITGIKLNADSLTTDRAEVSTDTLEPGRSEVTTDTLGPERIEVADDFILRPGEDIIKFGKDDLIIGGSGLMNQGADNEREINNVVEQDRPDYITNILNDVLSPILSNQTSQSYEPISNLPSIIEKQSSVLENIYNNVSTTVQKIEQTMSMKDINVNVSGTISVTDRNGNMVDLLRNSDVQNQIVTIVEDAFKRGKDQFG